MAFTPYMFRSFASKYAERQGARYVIATQLLRYFLLLNRLVV